MADQHTRWYELSYKGREGFVMVEIPAQLVFDARSKSLTAPESRAKIIRIYIDAYRRRFGPQLASLDFSKLIIRSSLSTPVIKKPSGTSEGLF